jgi:hypothetical protein
VILIRGQGEARGYIFMEFKKNIPSDAHRSVLRGLFEVVDTFFIPTKNALKKLKLTVVKIFHKMY